MADEARGRGAARTAAILTTVFVFMFAFAFIGLVTLLNDYANTLDVDDRIQVASEAPTEPFYVLLIGSDSRKGTALYTGEESEHAQLDQHSDIMTLMRVDPVTYTITLVSVPRDTTFENADAKINSALVSNNPEIVVSTVSELTGVNINYYMMTSFISFENLINALGGIDISVPQTIAVTDPASGKKVTVKAGKSRHLNGSEALVLARARKEYGANGDGLRQVNVRNIEKAMIEKVLELGDKIDIEHVLGALSEDTKTNMDLSSAGLLILLFVEHADEVQFYSGTGPYEGDERSSDKLWIVPADKEAWSALMAAVDAGGDPAEVIKPPKF